jgi:hypothetical protein
MLKVMSLLLQNVVVDNQAHHHHHRVSRLNSFRSANDLGNTLDFDFDNQGVDALLSKDSLSYHHCARDKSQQCHLPRVERPLFSLRHAAINPTLRQPS